MAGRSAGGVPADRTLLPPSDRPTTMRPASSRLACSGVLFALLVLPAAASSQTVEPDEEEAHAEGQEGHGEEEHHSIAGRHRITLGLGHTHPSGGFAGEDTDWLVLASWALNYDYWLTDRWAIGLQNDLVVESFVIEEEDEEELERNRPFAVIASGLYKPLEWLTLIGGIGREFVPDHKDLNLTRFGVELGWHVHPDWEVGGALVWDAKWGYYDSWGLDFAFSRFLGSGR